ncbi:MAG: helix-turn-helix domain-containing protein, partial [Bacteroidales bacterium]|nr:helix-turn-helix domain-containing protein [Bacteroidales bacterium]
QLQLAYDFVQFTGKNIFLTGKAGTGKTTFLHNLKKHSPKRMVVVAPTGVAAINAAGVTIHSFFQLSFGPQLPDYKTTEFINKERQAKVKRFSREKINIIKSMDLLIIDEISMVRADLLDGIDNTLRRFRNRNLPFGGVQLLMIGDLQQLAPVVKEDEWNPLRQYYDTPFFFSSKALLQTQYVSIELQYVYRQKDEYFIKLLNKIRDNKIDRDVIDELNARYKPDFNHDNAGYIILTTHNAKAKQINDSKLSRLSGKIHTFKAEVSGNFPEYTYPTDFELELKAGAQVMFVKNDPDPAKLFYNGKIGTVIKIDKDVVKVKCDGDEEPINVMPVEWQKMKYALDNETKEIKETVEGTFTQYPLKLAWAITIHKSQGLTFKKAIIDAEAAFAHGQVYVALSRLQSLEGLVLSTQILKHSVKHDRTVESFTKHYEENQPDKAELETSRKAYQQQLLTDLFDFNTLQKNIFYSIKLVNENSSSLPTGIREHFIEMNNNVREKIADVSVKFRNQLLYLFSKESDAEKNDALQERIKKASVYFSEHVKELVQNKIDSLNIETDNKAVRKSLKGAVDRLQQEAFLKFTCLHACQSGFIVKDYLETKAKASLEEHTPKPVRKKSTAAVSSDIAHPEFYKLLKAWRDAKAEEQDWDVYMVLQLKTMRELSAILPATTRELKAINGLGKKKIEMFGSDLLEMIISYRKENNIETVTFEEPEITVKVPKKSSKRISFELWKAGKTLKDIAKERQFATSTIEGHLAYFVGTGELTVEEIVSAEKVKRISDFFQKQETTLLSEAKAALGEDVTYSELHFVLQHLRFKSEIKD